MSETLAIGVGKQLAVAALHHVATEFPKANRAVAQIVCFPSAIGNAFDAKQSRGDFAIAGVCKTPVKCTKREHISVALTLGEPRRIGWDFATV